MLLKRKADTTLFSVVMNDRVVVIQAGAHLFMGVMSTQVPSAPSLFSRIERKVVKFSPLLLPRLTSGERNIDRFRAFLILLSSSSLDDWVSFWHVQLSKAMMELDFFLL